AHSSILAVSLNQPPEYHKANLFTVAEMSNVSGNSKSGPLHGQRRRNRAGAGEIHLCSICEATCNQNHCEYHYAHCEFHFFVSSKFFFPKICGVNFAIEYRRKFKAPQDSSLEIMDSWKRNFVFCVQEFCTVDFIQYWQMMNCTNSIA